MSNLPEIPQLTSNRTKIQTQGCSSPTPMTLRLNHGPPGWFLAEFYISLSHPVMLRVQCCYTAIPTKGFSGKGNPLTEGSEEEFQEPNGRCGEIQCTFQVAFWSTCILNWPPLGHILCLCVWHWKVQSTTSWKLFHSSMCPQRLSPKCVRIWRLSDPFWWSGGVVINTLCVPCHMPTQFLCSYQGTTEHTASILPQIFCSVSPLLSVPRYFPQTSRSFSC